MQLDYSAYFLQGAATALHVLTEAVAANPWPFVVLVALALLGVLLPRRRRRAR